MSSGDSDSHCSYPSDEDIPYAPCEFDTMSSSSSTDAEEITTLKQLPVTQLIVKEAVDQKSCLSLFSLGKLKDDLDSYLETLIPSKGDVACFPESMEQFLINEHQSVYDNLMKLNFGEFFIYLGRSLIVTLKIDNPRVRIPSSLICDVCVFSDIHPVVVLSIVKANYKPNRLDMYSTFLARGVTLALRNFVSDNISVMNAVVAEGSDISLVLQNLQASPFHVASSWNMCKEKSVEAAKALLRSTAIATSYPILYPESSKPNSLCFFNKKEFEFLSGIVDMWTSATSKAITGDKDLLSLELSVRLAKRGRTALLSQVIPHSFKLPTVKRLDVYDSVSSFASKRYEYIITDSPENVPSSVNRCEANVVIISADSSIGIALTTNNEKKMELSDDDQDTKKRQSFRAWFLGLFKRKNKSGSVYRTKVMGSVSLPNLEKTVNGLEEVELETEVKRAPSIQIHPPHEDEGCRSSHVTFQIGDSTTAEVYYDATFSDDRCTENEIETSSRIQAKVSKSDSYPQFLSVNLDSTGKQVQQRHDSIVSTVSTASTSASSGYGSIRDKPRVKMKKAVLSEFYQRQSNVKARETD